MKKFLGLALAGALSVAALPAVAADYPVKAPPPPLWTWTGFYIGVEAGAGWSRDNWYVPGLLVVGGDTGTGGIAGGTLGWNWQAPGSPWVLGIEGDFSWANIQNTGIPACGGPCTNRMDWFSTVRGRMGHANGPVLFFLTGGVAFAGFTSGVSGSLGVPNVTDTVTGWTGGGGLEGVLGGGWSMKGEYLYSSFHGILSCNAAAPPAGCGALNLANFSTHILRAGLNYKF